MRADDSGLHPATHAEQTPVGPSPQSGWIGQSRQIFAVRSRLLNTLPCGDAVTRLLSAMQAEMTRRHQPIGEDREGVAARMTAPASHPDPVVPQVVCLLAPPAMPDDGIAAAHRTTSREQLQRERRHPGSGLSWLLEE